MPSKGFVQLRTGRDVDAAALAVLSERTFRETFSADNAAEDVEQYVRETFGPEKQRDELRDPSRRIVIAWSADEAIGFYHLLAGVPEPSVTGPAPIELLRLYVCSRWHGQGVAAALLEHALSSSRAEGFLTMWLGVWERNLRARAFYRKWSFEEVGEHVFMLGRDRQRDLVLARGLRP
jgi:GNAT superfamily N-acetyltransferase